MSDRVPGEGRRAATRFNNNLRYRDADDPAQTQTTPEYVLRLVRLDLGSIIHLDPCTTSENPVGADRFYAPPEDGLSLPWDALSVFVNPPYGKARERWVDRCVAAAAEGRWVVLLMPAATDTRVFQRAAKTATAVVFIRGRLKFGVLRPNRRQAAASHPSTLLGWNTTLSASASLGIRWLTSVEAL